MQQILALIITGLMVHKLIVLLPLPQSVYYILAGVLLGPQLLNIWDSQFLVNTQFVRQFALIIILLRTGFSLDLKDIKQIGLTALLMSFIPAIFEITAVTLVAPQLFNISTLDAALLGSVLAAVSPAIVIPGMLEVIEDNLGQERKVPQLILAGASLDDIFAIVVFESLLNISLSTQAPFKTITTLPFKLVFGILLGYLLAKILKSILRRLPKYQILQAGFILIISILIISFEVRFQYSGLLAIMMMGFVLVQENPIRPTMKRIYTKVWTFAELLLFIVVGASVTFTGFGNVGLQSILLLMIALAFRSIGVLSCLLLSNLNRKEKLFAILSYFPKATVQAALGSIPLTMGLASGELILTMSVIAILFTAPLGAILIQKTKYILLD